MEAVDTGPDADYAETLDNASWGRSNGSDPISPHARMSGKYYTCMKRIDAVELGLERRAEHQRGRREREEYRARDFLERYRQLADPLVKIADTFQSSLAQISAATGRRVGLPWGFVLAGPGHTWCDWSSSEPGAVLTTEGGAVAWYIGERDRPAELLGERILEENSELCIVPLERDTEGPVPMLGCTALRGGLRPHGNTVTVDGWLFDGESGGVSETIEIGNPGNPPEKHEWCRAGFSPGDAVQFRLRHGRVNILVNDNLITECGTREVTTFSVAESENRLPGAAGGAKQRGLRSGPSASHGLSVLNTPRFGTALTPRPPGHVSDMRAYAVLWGTAGVALVLDHRDKLRAAKTVALCLRRLDYRHHCTDQVVPFVASTEWATPHASLPPPDAKAAAMRDERVRRAAGVLR